VEHLVRLALEARPAACLREQAVCAGGPRGLRRLARAHRRPEANRQLLADGPGTVTPPGHWNAIALDLIRSHQLSERAAAHLLAALNTAHADAFIACWDEKYTYWSERPVTAIRRELDPTFLPYITTPPFPSYVSGHSTTSGAASTVLAARFADAARMLRALAVEAAASRLYGGIHFRSDNEAGLALGKKIGLVAVKRYDVRG
jgi:membrane-associated phospholipid phosphatase